MRVDLMRPLFSLEVQGVATAAGCQLVASCDIAIASDNSWFATPGVDIGMCTLKKCVSPADILSTVVSNAGVLPHTSRSSCPGSW